jgi:hypothetical protein
MCNRCGICHLAANGAAKLAMVGAVGVYVVIDDGADINVESASAAGLGDPFGVFCHVVPSVAGCCVHVAVMSCGKVAGGFGGVTPELGFGHVLWPVCFGDQAVKT